MILSVFRWEIFVCAVHWLVERQRLVLTILPSMAADVKFSGEDMWLFSHVSISCRMATLNLSRELSA